MNKNLLFLFVLSMLACCIEIDISVPSFPDISDYFKISDGLTQMTVAVNFFGFCISSIICGPLSDSYGRRNVMIIGNGIMLIGAIGCVVSTSIELLLISRFIQGLGTSTSCVVVFAMIADLYPADKAAKLVGTMNALFTIFMTLAPISGSFINNIVGFRGNYLVVAIISLLSWVMLCFQLPETKKELEPLDIKIIIKNFTILLKSRNFVYASIAPSIAYSGYMSFITCMPFLYMETYKLPIMYYALNQGTILLVFSIFSMFSGKICNLIGERKSIIYGTSISMIGAFCSLLVALIFDNAPIMTTSSLTMVSIGSAISYPIIFAKSLDIFKEIKGTASSAIMVMRTFLCSISVAFSGYIYDGTLFYISIILVFNGIITIFITFNLLKSSLFIKKPFT